MNKEHYSDLAEFPDAVRRLEAGKVFGQVVITL